MRIQTNGRALLTQKEVMDLLKITRQTLYNWRKSGIIPEHRINRKLYFFEDEVINAIKQKEPISVVAQTGSFNKFIF